MWILFLSVIGAWSPNPPSVAPAAEDCLGKCEARRAPCVLENCFHKKGDEREECVSDCVEETLECRDDCEDPTGAQKEGHRKDYEEKKIRDACVKDCGPDIEKCLGDCNGDKACIDKCNTDGAECYMDCIKRGGPIE